NVDVGAADASPDNVYVDGTIGDDNLAIAYSGGVVTVAGLPYKVRVTSANINDPDCLHVRGNEGDDKIVANPPVEQFICLDLDGGPGNNTIRGGQAQPAISIADASITEGNS